MSENPDHFLLICTTCKTRIPAGDLQQAFDGRLPEGFALREVDCMAGCDHPRTVGFQAVGKAQYLFGGIGPDEVDALIAFARQYQSSDTGWTSATHRPRALFRKTLSRMPALPGPNTL